MRWLNKTRFNLNRDIPDFTIGMNENGPVSQEKLTCPYTVSQKSDSEFHFGTNMSYQDVLYEDVFYY